MANRQLELQCTGSGKGKCVVWKKGPSWGRSRSSRAGFQWQPQLSKKRDFLPITFPRELLQRKDDVLPTSKRMKMAIGERASSLKEREEEKDIPKTPLGSWE